MNIKILFLPFEAVGSHARRNSNNGTETHAAIPSELSFLSDQPRFAGSTYEAPDVCMPKGGASTLGTIGYHLQDIVTQQAVQLVDLQVNDEQVGRVLQSNNAHATPENINMVRRHLLNHQAKQELPLFIVLSENPTKEAFPDDLCLDLSTIQVNYKNLHTVSGSGIRAVNEMTVYGREDLASWHHVTPSYLARPTGGLYGGGKIEHMLKVDVSNGQHNFSFVGVHLRAKLTQASQDNSKAELSSLKMFLKSNNVDFAIGDFNLNVALDTCGHVGSVYDMPVEYVYPTSYDSHGILQHSPTALFATHQQFSNSTNSKHYMGALLISNDRIKPDLISSGSRTTSGLGYHSDHPPIFVSLDVLA